MVSRRAHDHGCLGSRRYANLLRAWKYGLDTDGSGKLGFVEFVNAARKHASADRDRPETP